MLILCVLPYNLTIAYRYMYWIYYTIDRWMQTLNTYNKPNERSLSKDSTIYHYRLLKRIHYKPFFAYMFWPVAAIIPLLSFFLIHPAAVLSGIVVVPVLHAFIIQLLLRTKERYAPKTWKWSMRFPWLGYVPDSYIALAKACRLHLHTLWIVFIIIGCFYPWMSPMYLVYLLFIHIWLLLPRLLLLFLLRKHRSNGYLKLNDNDTSCYAQ